MAKFKQHCKDFSLTLLMVDCFYYVVQIELLHRISNSAILHCLLSFPVMLIGTFLFFKVINGR